MNPLQDLLRVDECDIVITGSDRRVLVRSAMVGAAVSAAVVLLLTGIVGLGPAGCVLLAAAAACGAGARPP